MTYSGEASPAINVVEAPERESRDVFFAKSLARLMQAGPSTQYGDLVVAEDRDYHARNRYEDVVVDDTFGIGSPRRDVYVYVTGHLSDVVLDGRNYTLAYDLAVDTRPAQFPNEEFVVNILQKRNLARLGVLSVPELGATIEYPSATYAVPSTSAIEPRFRELAREWRDATAMLSSTQDKVAHRAYHRIMAMGRPALPLILRELRDNGGYWFWALTAIADTDVAEGIARFSQARDAWLAWGRDEGLIEA